MCALFVFLELNPEIMNHSNSLPKKSKQSSVKSKSLNDVGQKYLEKVEAGTSILNKSKQQEKWKPKPNTSYKGTSLQILSFDLVFT